GSDLQGHHDHGRRRRSRRSSLGRSRALDRQLSRPSRQGSSTRRAVRAQSAEKPEETVVIRKEKEPNRKENRPAGKVENALKLRFPLSHRACHQKQRNDRGSEPKATRKA